SIPLIHTHTQTMVIAHFISCVFHDETLVQGARQPRTACYSSCLDICALTH
ncbi:hypothetical protein COCMIDRAFT_58970, partial [Bipolaris oryzae ATCC 44560]